MTWIKQGRIFHLEPKAGRTTHAQVPTPHVMEDRVRVYYACRSHGMSFPAYFDLAKDLKTILKVHEEPIMEPGKPGMFDSDGVMPSCIVPHDNELWLYYIGWNEKSKTARYHNVIGLAVSEDGGETFQRMFDGPVMDRTPTEPGVCVMPFVFQTDNGIFHMYYQSGTGWYKITDKYEPVYVIKYAQSHDGIRWERHPDQCIESLYPLQAFSRPWVAKINGFESMWYCVRGSADYRGGDGSYRIECADALDKINFMRSVDTPKLFIGKEGEFDSDMQAYPSIFELDGKQVMLWNGNGFGQTGIGLAIWED